MGSATITDMSVELISNPDVFDEIYHSESEAGSDSAQSEDEASDSERIKIEKEALADSRRQRDALQETTSASSTALQLLDAFYNKFEDPSLSRVSKAIDIYVDKRHQLYDLRSQAQVEKEVLDKQIAHNEWVLRKLQHKGEKEQKTKLRNRHREQARQDRIKREKNATKRRLKNERINFWPKKVYKVVLNLDTGYDSPMSSRRGSINDASKPGVVSDINGLEVSSDPLTVSLRLSYTTDAASWMSRYDIAVDTTTNSGSIVYRGEFINSTSETWHNATVILSTSQASSQGLNELIPSLKPWSIRLQKNFNAKGSTNAEATVLSIQEQEFSRKIFTRQNQVWDLYRRSDLFGIPNQDLPWISPGSNNPFWHLRSGPLFSQTSFKQEAQGRPQVPGGVFGQKPASAFGVTTSSAFGQPGPPPPGAAQVQSSSAFLPGGATFSYPGRNVSSNSQTAGGLFGANSAISSQSQPETQPSDSLPSLEPDSSAPGDDSASTFSTSTLKTKGPLSKPTSTTLTTALSTTHTLPHRLTLTPSFVPRRHILSHIPLSALTLTRTTIPKLRLAAFLRAKITNPPEAGTPLLSGAAGLTVDGSFLGSTTLPQCAPGEDFDLPMGVDPKIEVEYEEPTVRKVKGGGFMGIKGKEEKAIYSRSIVVRDRRSGVTAVEDEGEEDKEGQGGRGRGVKPVQLIVKDQIPISSEEEGRVAIEILSPRGLKNPGDKVDVGVGEAVSPTIETGSGSSPASAKRAGKKTADREWGTATASLGKRGEVEWDVHLNPGKAVRLGLEYEVRWPGGEGVVSG